MAESNDVQVILKPLYERASDAEERLARLEAAVASKTSSRDEKLSEMVAELQSELEEIRAKQAAERENALKEMERLAAENAKLEYRISHLVRALREADCKLASS